MPIERRSSAAQIRSILIAVVTVALVGTLGYAVVRVATGQTPATAGRATDGRWNAGAASTKAAEIDRDGPILIPDPTGAQRLPLVLSHVGDSSTEGWYAFEARPPDATEDCFLSWDAEQEHFTAPCTDETYPLDGEGLRQFGTSVTKDGELIVDLSPEDP